MTNEQNPTPNYEAFVSSMNEIMKVKKLSDSAQDPRSAVKDKAKKDIREYAFSNAVAEMPENARQLANPDALTDEQVQRWMRFGHDKANETSANILSQNLDSIIDKEMPREGLEKLARIKNVAEKADEKQREVLDVYALLKSKEDFLKDYEGGKKIDKDKMKVVAEAAAEGLGEELAKGLKEKGYSTDIQNAIRGLAAHAVAEGHINGEALKGYAVSGLKKDIEEIRAVYQKIAEKSGSADAVAGNIIKKLAKGSREEFNMARDLIYGVGA